MTAGQTKMRKVELRMITGIGFSVSLISCLLGFWAIGVRLFSNYDAVPG